MNEFKKRIFTSLPLFLILYLSFISYLTLSLVLFIIIFILLNELNNIYFKIFKKKKLLHLIFIFITVIYLIYFILGILFFINFDNYDNKIILLFLLSISISTDIGGYTFGKLFKGKKLIKISPNKTYSGLIGSLIVSILVSAIFFRNLDLPFDYLIITILYLQFHKLVICLFHF